MEDGEGGLAWTGRDETRRIKNESVLDDSAGGTPGSRAALDGECGGGARFNTAASIGAAPRQDIHAGGQTRRVIPGRRP
jgi:hypothetical protein